MHVANAQYNLGVKYYQGEGVPKNFTEAYFWLSLAEAAGKPRRAKVRDLARAKLTPAQVADVHARTATWQPKPQSEK